MKTNQIFASPKTKGADHDERFYLFLFFVVVFVVAVVVFCFVLFFLPSIISLVSLPEISGERGGLAVNSSDSGSRGRGFEPHSGQTVFCP